MSFSFRPLFLLLMVLSPMWGFFPPPVGAFFNKVLKPFQTKVFVGSKVDKTSTLKYPFWSLPRVDFPTTIDQAEPKKGVEQSNNPEQLHKDYEVHKDLIAPIARQMQILSERCLKSDIILGITEGVIFEVCKVLVDASAPLTGIHVSHALNAKQDEASYLVRGLLQEIMLNAVGPSIGVDSSSSYRMGRYSRSGPEAAAPLSAPPSSDHPTGEDAGSCAGSPARKVTVSLQVDMDTLSSLPSLSPSPGADDPSTPTFNPLLLGLNTNYSLTSSRGLMNALQRRLDIQERAHEIVMAQRRRRQRMGTIVVLRSFVAPLLIHSFAHILPSFLSHELIEDIEAVMDGGDAASPL